MHDLLCLLRELGCLHCIEFAVYCVRQCFRAGTARSYLFATTRLLLPLSRRPVWSAHKELFDNVPMHAPDTRHRLRDFALDLDTVNRAVLGLLLVDSQLEVLGRYFLAPLSGSPARRSSVQNPPTPLCRSRESTGPLAIVAFCEISSGLVVLPLTAEQ